MAKNDNPLVSVIVPVYNIEKYIDECLESIVVQTYTNLEIILVDDASKDRSSVICDKWTKKDGRIKVIHKSDNEGAYQARITGFEIMHGDYFIAIDGDDYVSNDYVQELFYAANDNDTDITILDGYKTFETDSRKESITTFPRLYSSSNLFDSLMRNVANRMWGWTIWGKMYKSSIYKKARRHLISVERYINAADDTLFSIVCAYFANKAKYVNGYSGYYYRQSKNSITGKMSDDDFIVKLDSITTVLFEIEKFMETVKVIGKYKNEFAFLKEWQISDYVWTIRNEYIRQNDKLQLQYDKLQLQYDKLQKEHFEVLNSKRYRLGKHIADPYIKIRKMLK